LEAVLAPETFQTGTSRRRTFRLGTSPSIDPPQILDNRANRNRFCRPLFTHVLLDLRKFLQVLAKKTDSSQLTF